MKRLLAIAALALAACYAEVDPELDVEDSTLTEQAGTLPPCTAANEGATHILTTNQGSKTVTSTYECQYGTWQLIRRCSGGTCIDF
ncbi:hypothetical protein [Polyangium mundeleinium]|uniref:Lipoprotein n=1 Tax=Polyangium mundeleinium TaxID=2995306 RepID=A0ABT5EUG3_9BACT|nr:hypothetical protein [Polyangium mundeleinium]MDC0745416.1 hypothetical protein [Polyangium mundeleinium]